MAIKRTTRVKSPVQADYRRLVEFATNRAVPHGFQQVEKTMTEVMDDLKERQRLKFQQLESLLRGVRQRIDQSIKEVQDALSKL